MHPPEFTGRAENPDRLGRLNMQKENANGKRSVPVMELLEGRKILHCGAFAFFHGFNKTALAHYGMIPESVYLILSASTRKTSRFKTGIGEFSYRTIRPSLFWGYAIQQIGHRHYKIASPEKALLDFFYLHAAWKSDHDFKELRLDREDSLSSLIRHN